MEYKDTLNLPKTDFPMKADLPKKEPDYLKKWDTEKIYEKLLAQNKDKPKFILHDGPPYANGNIHFGHILNKILKDIIIKYKNISGFYSPYIPGWDCHGLPIELGAVKELVESQKKEASQIPIVERREACRKYANNFVNSQKTDFRRLGIFGDWENPYLTLTNQYEADIAREFVTLYKRGYVYEGKKPVYWCTSCQTALAEAEVEYENLTSPSIFVKFELHPDSIRQLDIEPDLIDGRKISFVIWTTTPWTLPANVALAIGSQYNYVALDLGKEIYIVAHDLKDQFLKACNITDIPIDLEIWSGENLAKKNLNCLHPFIDRNSKVVIGDHVTLETGTGIVHIAPGHGQEDFQVGQSNGLETLCPVDGGGKYIKNDPAFEKPRFDEIKDWAGLFVKKADKVIVEFLNQKGILLNKPGEMLPHSYPHCWRCKSPLIFRATKQWFCSLSHNNLRKEALRTIDCDVKWIPTWGHERIYGMIENRPDWCLSRQRIWGVPIIVHKCADCETAILDEKIGEHICKVFEKEGADAWWKSDEPILPSGTKCPKCQSSKFVKDGSILDVWFDSGVSHAAVLEKNSELHSPADLYLEGSDQHRGWFHSSLLTSLGTRDRAPYKAVLTHGFVVDGEGRKYSKSAKNYVPPDKVLNQMGAEILRLWVAAEDYRNDIRVSDEILKVLGEVYRKIRNTCRFILGNLYDFDPAVNTIPFEKRTELDRYALHLLSELVTKIKAAYENYEFHVVHHSLNRFFTVELSAFYLDILKDRLYCEKANDHLRRSAQSTLYDLITTLTPLMSPILSFTADEIWQQIPGNKEPSVFLAHLSNDHESWKDSNLNVKWERIYMIRDEVLKSLEVLRQKKEIAHSLDAKILLSAESSELLNFLNHYAADWAQIFIVSQTQVTGELKESIVQSKTVPSLKIVVQRAQGQKCERCWNYSTEIGTDKNHPGLCPRCTKAVS